ncbi:MAG: hypothetical protein WBA12_12705, partial [Catalinimonas sp.]
SQPGRGIPPREASRKSDLNAVGAVSPVILLSNDHNSVHVIRHHHVRTQRHEREMTQNFMPTRIGDVPHGRQIRPPTTCPNQQTRPRVQIVTKYAAFHP